MSADASALQIKCETLAQAAKRETVDQAWFPRLFFCFSHFMWGCQRTFGELSCGNHVLSLVRPVLWRPPLPSSVVTPARDIRGLASRMISSQSSAGSTSENVVTTGSGSAECVLNASSAALTSVPPAAAYSSAVLRWTGVEILSSGGVYG